jgi:uncharacterized protein YegL
VTDANKTLIGILVDRSGSMQSCKTDMEGGINTLIEEQAEQPGDCEVTLAQFDTQYEYVWETRAIAKAEKYKLTPRGGTALLDAMGKFITEIGEQLADRKAAKRPGKVVIVVVTDGYENSSKEWTRSDVKDLVTQQKNIYSWEFMFLGANMDAVAEGGSIGISPRASMTFDAQNSAAVGAAYAATSNLISGYRGGQSIQYTEADRANAGGQSN